MQHELGVQPDVDKGLQGWGGRAAHRTKTQGMVKELSSCTLVMKVKRYAST